MKTDAEVATFLDRLTMALEIAVGTIQKGLIPELARCRDELLRVQDEVRVQVPPKKPSAPLEPRPSSIGTEFLNLADLTKLPTEDQCDTCAGSGVYWDNGVPQACNCVEVLKTAGKIEAEEDLDDDDDNDDVALENAQAEVEVAVIATKKRPKSAVSTSLKRDMQCRQVTDGARCSNKSRGPRYRFMCSEHEEAGRPQCTWIGKGAVRCTEKACSPGALCAVHQALEDRAQQGLPLTGDAA